MGGTGEEGQFLTDITAHGLLGYHTPGPVKGVYCIF